jgi:hypothetical protein
MPWPLWALVMIIVACIGALPAIVFQQQSKREAEAVLQSERAARQAAEALANHAEAARKIAEGRLKGESDLKESALRRANEAERRLAEAASKTPVPVQTPSTATRLDSTEKSYYCAKIENRTADTVKYEVWNTQGYWEGFSIDPTGTATHSKGPAPVKIRFDAAVSGQRRALRERELRCARSLGQPPSALEKQQAPVNYFDFGSDGMLEIYAQ